MCREGSIYIAFPAYSLELSLFNINYEDVVVNFDKSQVRGGLSARFYPIDENIGIKLYNKSHIRDKAFENQKLLHSHGLAPKAFEKIELSTVYKYGYITERVTPMWDCFLEEGVDDTFYEVEEKEANRKLIEECKEKLEKLNIYYCDDHVGNFGFTKEGNLVVIDTENL